MNRPITPAQQRALQLLSQGLTVEEIGAEQGVSYNTIRTHIAASMRRLQAHTRVHAVAICFREGWVE